MSCDDPSLPCDGRNLVVRASVQFHQLVAATVRGKNAAGTDNAGAAPIDPWLSIHLEKRIPAGGGLGGGSADAARTLLGLNRLWATNRLWVQDNDREVGEAERHQTGEPVGDSIHPGKGPGEVRGSTGRSLDELAAIAARLGSDVPFFLYGPSSVCKGRGESVRPIGAPERAKWVTLVLPPIGMPTADVYRRFDQMNLGREQDVEREPSWKQWVTLGSRSLLPMLVNDLEAPAFAIRPDLGDLRADIERALGRPVRMSGSGSSLFTLYDEQAEAEAAARQVTSGYTGVRALAIELCPVVNDDLAR